MKSKPGTTVLSLSTSGSTPIGILNAQRFRRVSYVDRGYATFDLLPRIVSTKGENQPSA